MLLPGYWLAARKAAVLGLCRRSLWFLGSSSVGLGFLYRSDKLLDLLFQGLVPLLHILPGAFHVAEADFQGCWLLLLILQFFTEPHHLSPHVIIFLLEATKKGRKEWDDKAWPLDSPSGLAHRHPVRFTFHITRPISSLCLLLCPTPDRRTSQESWTPRACSRSSFVIYHPSCDISCCFSYSFVFCIFHHPIKSLNEDTTSNTYSPLASYICPALWKCWLTAESHPDSMCMDPQPLCRDPQPLCTHMCLLILLHADHGSEPSLMKAPGDQDLENPGSCPLRAMVLPAPPTLLNPIQSARSTGFLNSQDFHCYCPKS